MFRDEIMSKKEERTFFLVPCFSTFFLSYVKITHFLAFFLDCTLLYHFKWHFNIKLSSWDNLIKKKIGGSLGQSTFSTPYGLPKKDLWRVQYLAFLSVITTSFKKSLFRSDNLSSVTLNKRYGLIWDFRDSI